MLSNPTRIAAAIPVVLCYGYARLCACLLEHEWWRAAAYCRQLLARRPDPLLDDLLAWLATLETKV